MKKYLLTVLTLIFAFGFCANAYADTDDEEYEDKYAAVINDYYDYVANYSSKSSKAEKYKCLSEIAGFSGKLQLKDVGYSIEDITGDEVPELIFCKVDKYSGKNSTGKDVRAVYSIVDEEPKLIFQSKNYNNFSHIGNGKYQTLGICRLTKSGSKLKWDNFYFLKTKKVYGYYRSILFSNKTGKTDEKSSKERVIKDQEFARL